MQNVSRETSSVRRSGRGTTRVKSHRNRPPRALALLPEPVGVLPPLRATVRSWQSPCRAIRGFVGWRRMFHVKHLQSVERAARTTLVKSRRDHRPLAVALLTEPASVFLSSLAAMRSWQSPPLAIRSFVDRRRMFHVKHLQSVERAARTTLVKSRRDHRPLAVALLTEPASVFLSSLAAMRSWQSPPLAIRSFVDRCRMFHVKHLRSVEAAGERPASSLIATVPLAHWRCCQNRSGFSRRYVRPCGVGNPRVAQFAVSLAGAECFT